MTSRLVVCTSMRDRCLNVLSEGQSFADIGTSQFYLITIQIMAVINVYRRDCAALK